MIVSRLSPKGQVTVPAEVRRHLGLKPGDTVAYSIDGGRVTLTKLSRVDAAFLRASTESFSDWNAPEADEAFRDL